MFLTILSDNYDKSNKLQYQVFSCIITTNSSLRYFIISAFVVLIASQSYNNKNDARLKSLVEGVSYVSFVLLRSREMCGKSSFFNPQPYFGLNWSLN